MMALRTVALLAALTMLGGCIGGHEGMSGAEQSGMAPDDAKGQAMPTMTMPMMARGRDDSMPMTSMAGMMDGHIEGRLAFLKTELHITDSQMPQWNAFADAMRASAKRMAEMHGTTMHGGAMGAMPARAPERLDRIEKMMSAHLESLRAAEAALRPLYAVLSDEQKKEADALLVGPPMGMM